MTGSISRLAKRILPYNFRPYAYLEGLVKKRTGLCVQRGPFSGLKYVERSVGSTLMPKLLGIYERELIPAVEEIIAGGFERVIDIGAAEGYYTIGLAQRIPGVLVHAYEMNEQGRTLLSQMATLNGVSERVLVHGRCEPDDLRACLSAEGRTAVICDAEGHESVLLDPEQVPLLARAHILVEMHELFLPGVTETIRSRFAATHEITQIWETDREASEFLYRTLLTPLLPSVYLRRAVSELRPDRMYWFWMRPIEHVDRPDGTS